MVIKAVEKNKQVLSTNLNISYTYTKYSSLEITVPVSEWKAYLPFDSYIPGPNRVGSDFIFQRITLLKYSRNSVD